MVSDTVANAASWMSRLAVAKRDSGAKETASFQICLRHLGPGRDCAAQSYTLGGHMEVRLNIGILKIVLLSFVLAGFSISPLFAAEAAIHQLDTVLKKTVVAEPASPACADTTELNSAVQAGNLARQALANELTRYKNLQLALTSGLVAALLTAIGAVATLVVTSRNSRPERDLKRLEVVEKGAQMRGDGIEIPPDIVEEYLVSGVTVERETG
jgi:hypothetical protein